MENSLLVKCPWCGEEIIYKKAARHINTSCKKKPRNISEKDSVDATIVAMYGNVVDDIINDYKNNFSLPDLRNKYGINYNLSQKLLSIHGVELRNISNSAKYITANKVKISCQKNYGVDNPSQLESVKNKKKETFIEHYGVDNIWKTEEYKDFTRNRWNSYSEDEKTRVLKGFVDRHKNGTISKLEKRVLSVLNDIGIPYETQFKVGKYFHRYDAKISNSKILLEINGDFWHANPKFFKENDVLNFSETNHPKAKDIWKKDEKNRKVAENNGYKILYLWENDITDKTDIEIGKLIIEEINKIYKS